MNLSDFEKASDSKVLMIRSVTSSSVVSLKSKSKVLIEAVILKNQFPTFLTPPRDSGSGIGIMCCCVRNYFLVVLRSCTDTHDDDGGGGEQCDQSLL